MALCTINDIRKILPEKQLQLLIKGNELLVTSAIDQAESDVEADVSLKYEWPLSPFPKKLGSMTAILAVCNLYRSHSKIPDVWVKEREYVRSTLKDIVRGTVTLARDAGKETPTSGFSVASGKKRMAGAGGMLEGYQ